jgi:hypothetical protein
MEKAFLVFLPFDLHKKAKELSQREGPPISFLVREGLELALERRKREELLRLASRDVLSKKRKIEALKKEILRLKRLGKSQSEDLERIEKGGLV